MILSIRRWRIPASALLAGCAFAATAATPAADLTETQRLLQAGKAGDALRRIDDALRTNPSDAEWRFLRGVALTDLQRPNEAIKVYGRLIEERPELPAPRNNLAVLYAQQGQFDKARVTFEDAIRTNPVYAAAYDNLGDVQARLAGASYAQALQMPDAASAPAPSLTLVRDLAPSGGKVLVAQATPAPAKPAPTPPPASVPMVTPPAAASVAKPAPVPPAASAAASSAAKPAVAVASAAPAKPAASATIAAAPSAPRAPASAGMTQSQAAAQLRDAVVSWANAWSRKDLDAYFAAYVPGYGGGKSPASWKQDRRARILGKSQIEVTVSSMVVEVDGDLAKVRFRQSYRSDKLSVESNKTLVFSHASGKWLITRESAGS
ncbi:MAG: tetratricopeptide repeat protein [Burkholderiales bacterium]